MRKSTIKYTIGIISLITLAAFTGCGAFGAPKEAPTPAPNAKELTVLSIGTADAGGTMYPAGEAIASAIMEKDPSITVNVTASGGSFDNINAIAAGQIDMGLVTGDAAASAFAGAEGTVSQSFTDLRVIGAVYSSISTWMVLADSDLQQVNDLADHTCSIGPSGSTTDLSARAALSALSLTDRVDARNLSIRNGCELLSKGNLDAAYGFAGTPISGMAALADTVPVRFLSYTAGELDSILEKHPFYYRTTIPAGAYAGQEEPVDTFGVKCLLCVSASMDEDTAYHLTEILDSSAGDLAEKYDFLAGMKDVSFRCLDLPIPLHGGAKKYYGEIGALDH